MERFIFTAKGLEYIAKTTTGKILRFTRGKFGDGITDGDGSELTDLINPIGELVILKRVVTGNQITVTTQFSNVIGDNTLPAFRLTELGLFGKLQDINGTDDPENPETVICYAHATGDDMGDYISPIPTKFTVNWPFSTSNADNVQIVIPRPDNGGIVTAEIVIPSSGWTTAEGTYICQIDVEMKGISSEQLPVVVIHEESLSIVAEIELCPTVETFDDKIRFKAKAIPNQTLNATVILLSEGGVYGSGGGYDEYVLPVATADTLGGVMIGENISVTEDGTISTSKGLAPSDMATPEEVRALLDEVFNKE